jgi:hypothetical protein
MCRGIRALVVAVVCGAGLAAGATANASADAAASGAVLVFQHELTATTRYVNPKGCTKLPLAAHLLVNTTDKDVKLYADPLCLTYSMVVPPGYGAHIPPVTGSFSV